MKPYFLLFTLTFLATPKSFSQSNQHIQNPPEGFEAIFNGYNLDGWESFNNGNNKKQKLFEIVEGAIHTYPNADTTEIQPFGALQTKKTYSKFVLELEYKWGIKKYKPRQNDVRDGGVLFHTFGPNEIWPRGAECQIQEGDTGDLWLVKVKGTSRVSKVNLCYQPNHPLYTIGDGKKEYAHVPRSYFWEVPGWNHVRIEVKDDEAKFYVNGKLVNEVMDLEYFSEDSAIAKHLDKGKILLQAEGAELFYRNIFIKEL